MKSNQNKTKYARRSQHDKTKRDILGEAKQRKQQPIQKQRE
jgi:hypothetical protein